MSEPVKAFLSLRSGRFRSLTWGEGTETVLFLHGLTGVSEVWGPTVGNLPPSRRYVAMDQRGHGKSPASPTMKYTPGAFVEDSVQAIRILGGRVHLVGHSMGARIAMILAARHPELVQSVAIVDIGPEASKANIEATSRGIRSRPEQFQCEQEALDYGFRKRTATEAEASIFLARLRKGVDGSMTWLSPGASLVACVSGQRNRSYWQDWKAISGPVLFVHGGSSNEVSVAIADRMREMNPGARFLRLDGVGHNIPLLAPAELAATLNKFWLSSATLAP